MPSTTSSNGVMDSLSEQFEGISISGIPDSRIVSNNSTQPNCNTRSTASRTPDAVGHIVATSARPRAAMASSNIKESLSASKYADPASPPSTIKPGPSARGPGSWAYRRGAEIPVKKGLESSAHASALPPGDASQSVRAPVLPGTTVPGPIPLLPQTTSFPWSFTDLIQANAIAAQYGATWNNQYGGAEHAAPFMGNGTTMHHSGYAVNGPFTMSDDQPAATAYQSYANPSSSTSVSPNPEQVRKWKLHLEKTETRVSPKPNEHTVVDNMNKHTKTSELQSAISPLQERTNRLGPTDANAPLQSTLTPNSVPSGVPHPATPAAKPAAAMSAIASSKAVPKAVESQSKPAELAVQKATAPTPKSTAPLQSTTTPETRTQSHNGVGALLTKPVATPAPVKPASALPDVSEVRTTASPTDLPMTPRVKANEGADKASATMSTLKPKAVITTNTAESGSLSAKRVPFSGPSNTTSNSTSPGPETRTPASDRRSEKDHKEASNIQPRPSGPTHEQQMQMARELQASFSRSGGKSRGARKSNQDRGRRYASLQVAPAGPASRPTGRVTSTPQAQHDTRLRSALNPGGHDLHGGTTGRGRVSADANSMANHPSGRGVNKNTVSLVSQHSASSTRAGAVGIVSRHMQPIKAGPLAAPSSSRQGVGNSSLSSSLAQDIAKLAREFRENMGIEEGRSSADSKKQLVQAGFLDKWPEAPVRRGPDPNQRRVTISGFTDRGSAALVFSIVWGGTVELVEFEDGASTADVVFLQHRDCMEYYEVTASKIRVRDEEYTVKLAEKLDPPHPDRSKWFAVKATRILKATPVPRTYSLKKLLRMGKVYNAERLETTALEACWVFMGIEGAYNFRASIEGTADFQGITFEFGVDPCREAEGVHAE